MIRYRKKYTGWGYARPKEVTYSAVGDEITDEAGNEVSGGEDPGYRPDAVVEMSLGHVNMPRHGEDPSELYSNTKLDKGEQQTLFHTVPSKITHASADHRLRGAAATNLLAMAYNEAHNLGHGITYDDSLSSHSSPLAKMGLDLGLVVSNPHNPSADITNGIALEGAHRNIRTVPAYFANRHSPRGEEIEPEEVSRGRSTVRNWINQRRTLTLGKQFDSQPSSDTSDQLQLPGLENDEGPVKYVPIEREFYPRTPRPLPSRDRRIIRGIDEKGFTRRVTPVADPYGRPTPVSPVHGPPPVRGRSAVPDSRDSAVPDSQDSAPVPNSSPDHPPFPPFPDVVRGSSSREWLLAHMRYNRDLNAAVSSRLQDPSLSDDHAFLRSVHARVRANFEQIQRRALFSDIAGYLHDSPNISSSNESAVPDSRDDQ